MDKISPESAYHHNGFVVSEAEFAFVRDTPRESARHQRGFQSFLFYVGTMIVGLGLVLTAVGSISLFSSWRTIGGSRYYWAAFVGLPLIAIGSAFTQAENLGGYDANLFSETNAATMDQGTRDGAGVACKRCHATNSAAANFCNQCGTSLKASTCRGCGAKIAGNSRFCTQCGKALA